MRSLSRLPIPNSWHDIDACWMHKALARDCPGAVVDSVTLDRSDDGTNRRAKFSLTYAEGSGPQGLFLKAHASSHRWVHFRNGNLFNEARLFSTGIELPLEHPKVYASRCDYLHLDFLLVMEDITLRGADPRDATRPLSVDQAASGLKALARLHSQYWNQTPNKKLRFVKHWKPAKGWQVGLRKRIPIGMQRGAALLPATIGSMDAVHLVELWSRYIACIASSSKTLLHGDAHIGNTYVLPDNTVGFLDWQVVRWGGWSQDVGYFLQGALTPEDRRQNDRDLLRVYRAALTVPESDKPSQDDIWRDYCAASVYGLAIWLSTLGTDGWQDKVICEALVERYAIAWVELGGLENLQQLSTALGVD